MADKIKVRMLRAVGGHEEGATASYGVKDAHRLVERGAAEYADKSMKALENKETASRTRTQETITDTASRTSSTRRSRGTDPVETETETEKATMDMSKDELMERAEKAGVTVETDDNKADLVRKINAKA